MNSEKNKKINIKIENYRSIENTEIEIRKGGINYLLGGNESGKSNILNSLRIPDLNNQEDFQVNSNDKTIKDSIEVKEQIKITIKIEDAINIFYTSGPSESLWFYVESKARKKYNSFVENEIKNRYQDLIGELENRYNRAELYSGQKPEIQSIILKLISGKYVTSIQRQKVCQVIKSFGPINEHLEKIINEMKISYPRVRYVEPIIKAKQRDKISYPYESLFQEESTLRNICEKFLDNDQKEIISKLREQFDDEGYRNRYRYRLFDKLNDKVKEYFSKFEHIRAYPKFRSEQSEVILDVISKDSWSIDSGDENERSLGYKSFLRIVTELIATESSNEDILYIIDEPEQSLHPYLQIELLKTMESVVKNNSNLYILLVTHSPYMIKYNNNFNVNFVSFVKRNEIGASVISNMGNEAELLNYIKDYNKGKKSQSNYLFKILRDSHAWQKKEIEIESGIDRLQKLESSRKMTPNEFLKKITGLWALQQEIKKNN